MFGRGYFDVLTINELNRTSQQGNVFNIYPIGMMFKSNESSALTKVFTIVSFTLTSCLHFGLGFLFMMSIAFSAGTDSALLL